MRIKAALFDLDGVVFDTEPQYTVFWGTICKEYHPEEVGLEHRIKGQTLTQIFDTLFPGQTETQASVTERLNAFERDMRLDYIPGFVSFVQDLHAHGVKTAVVTSSNREKMKVVYKKRPEFSGYFDRVLTSEDFAHSKPAPDCYLKGAEVFGALPQECVGFEDSLNGLRAVREAGAYTIGLATTNSREVITPLSDQVIDDFTHLTFDGMMKWIG